MSAESPKPFKPRGSEASLPHAALPEVIPSYLLKLIEETGGAKGPIGLQFIAQPGKETANIRNDSLDVLNEDKYEVAPGLIYKYTGRALWTITRKCAAYCRFCTRGREVGIPDSKQGMGVSALAHTPTLSEEQIEKTLNFIRNKRDIREIILSGGDPLTVKPEKLLYITGELGKMQEKDKLDIVRVATRLPIQNPLGIREEHYEAVSKLNNPYLMVHINHPAELTASALEVLGRFRKDGASVLSQTVLLAGVNNNVETLVELFNKMAKSGIRPYYVFQCEPVYWARHFAVPVGTAINLWQKVRPLLSGVAATAKFVFDVPGGRGKVVIPEGGAWKVDYFEGYNDFDGTNHPLT